MARSEARSTKVTDAESHVSGIPALVYCVYVEIVKMLRIPQFAFFSLIFPVLLFAMFGLPNVGDSVNQTTTAGQFMMASFGTYAVMAVGLFTFGVAIASERGMGWNRLLRATPLPSITHLLSKVVMAGLFGLATLGLLFLFGGLVGHIPMSLERWAALTGLLLVGMVPFVALGLWLGYFAGPNSAVAIVNLIYLPLAFASGLFVPLPNLPKIVQVVAPYLPSYHIAELGWTLLGAGDAAGQLNHLLWLAGYTVLFLGLAVVAYRRDEGITFG
ncbi:MAG TPA: ABC transporter permease [Chloroflexota bacterium]|nr:ABC transporter permease [Chloroflexota bacterium]